MTEFLPASTESLIRALPQPMALVANGHPGRELGHVIDRYSTVIRFNNFLLEGFSALVGTRTSARAVNGWTDLETRHGEIAISPFTADALESMHLSAFRAKHCVPVLHAATDIHALLPGFTKPSTELAFAALCSHLGLEADCFGFDGFTSGHYWDPDTALHTTHSRSEVERLLQLPGITLYGRSFDYASLYDFCHTEHKEHTEYGVNEGLILFPQHGITLPGESVIVFGAGNGDLSRHLERHGSNVTVVEVSPTAYERIPVADKILGDALTLCTLERTFDHFVSVDVLEHLTENDIRIVARESARLAKRLTVSVCTRPSELVGPAGENLHLTVRPVRWWIDLFGRWFDIEVGTGHGLGQLLLTGTRRAVLQNAAPVRVPRSPASASLELPSGYIARERPDYFVDSTDVCGGVTWQPDVYTMAAAIARASGCRTIVDIGCGQARKLSALYPEFRVIGIDYGENINWCRRTHAFGTWLESDLEQHEPLPIPSAVLSEAVIVCSDVIEHLVDPRALLATLRDLLVHARFAVLTTPDRTRTHGPIHAGPPPNHAHTREWTTEELRRLCELQGLHSDGAGHTRSNDVQSDLATVALVLRGAAREIDDGVMQAAVIAGFVPLQSTPHATASAGVIPSTQRNSTEQPRFVLRVGADAEALQWYSDAERDGGIEAETRIFLDAQLESCDLMVDLCPDAGFVMMSAATAPGGAPTVLGYGGDSQTRENWRQSAVDAGREIMTADSGRRTLLATDIGRHLNPQGRLFVHATASDVGLILDSCNTAGAIDQLVAICLAPTDDAAGSIAAAGILHHAGFALTQLAERAGEVVMQPAAPPFLTGLIAVQASLIDVPFESATL